MPETYSPFEVPLRDLDATHLDRLRSVNEGWYVDYKRELISAKDIAKALSAFSNTYGRWLIFGVAEVSKEEPSAGEFPGIPRADVEVLLQRIRQGANSHLSPTPHFETKTVWGPNDALNLASDNAVVCVQVPMSFETPHVHSDGRIYRRVADASEPRAETDRFILDGLWRRRKPVEKSIRKWIDRKPEFSKRESKNPYVRLLLSVDPWGERLPWLEASLSEFRDLMNRPPEQQVHLPFDAIHTTNSGFIARQLAGNDPQNLTLTWRISRALSSEVLLPLNVVSRCEPDEVASHLEGYENAGRFENILSNAGAASPSFADLNHLFVAINAVCGTYRRLLRAAGAEPHFQVKAQILNAWRVVPFIDAAFVMEAFEKHGIAMSLSGEFLVPFGKEPNSFFPIEAYADREDMAALLQSSLIFELIAEAWGLPRPSLASGDQSSHYEQLWDAQRRAAARQNKTDQ